MNKRIITAICLLILTVIPALAEVSTEDVVTFGVYEQDNDSSNGAEPIAWQVLAVDDGKALLISVHGLDAIAYNPVFAETSWEECALRTWLNGDFINAAFSAEQQSSIITTHVAAQDNPNYGTNAGNDTEDLVFLLSLAEAEKYFADDASRRCAPTAYAVARGAWRNGNGIWWLRSPGNTQRTVAYVYIDGSLRDKHHFTDASDHMVRPALWVDVSAIDG